MDKQRQDRILLVDDERHLLISLRDYLSSEKFEVVVAQSGEEALEHLEQVTPDLIVLDISMPGMGGLGFLKRISSPDGKTKYPVLVLTARSTMKEFFDTVEVDGFLAKPCDEAQLMRKIREILAGRSVMPEKQGRSRKKVLLAEDDGAISKHIIEALGRAGYDAEVVESGPEVLEKASVMKPDVILMKEILPRLNGSAVASLVEVMPSISRVPVVLYDESQAGREDLGGRYSSIKCVRKVLKTRASAALVKAVEEVSK